ncbi:unannotated protein [freshwater metagenome]|uniref:Unannotated protein n=1 Tax=freshwater metagenome TaxID=449393 RepID=A0A6J7ILR3_9ZZZZ
MGRRAVRAAVRIPENGGKILQVGRKLDPDEAAAVMRAAGMEPLAPYPGSARRWECRCGRCGRVVYPEHRAVRSGQGGCAFCGRADALAALRVDPERAVRVMLGVGLRPLEPYTTSKATWRCECLTCGEIVVSMYCLGQQGRGCPDCGRKRGAAKRRFSHEFAAEAMRAAGLEPLEPYPGTMLKWRCTCVSCGEEVETTRSKVISSGLGCPRCALPKTTPAQG